MTAAVQARRLVRKGEFLKILGDSKTQFHENVKRRKVTAPVKIGDRVVALPSDELDAIVAARVAGLAEAEMQALVDRLHAQRKATLGAILGHS